MLSFIARRLLIMIPTLWLVSVVSFIIIELPPGDIATTIVGRMQAAGEELSADEIKAMTENLRVSYGYGEPLPVRYGRWISRFVRGDFGFSLTYRKPVRQLIDGRIAITAVISVLTILLASSLSWPVGVGAAIRQYSLFDNLFSFVAFFLMAVPNFLFALVLIFLAFRWFGFVPGGLFSMEYIDQPFSFAKFLDFLAHIWVPLVVLGAEGAGKRDQGDPRQRAGPAPHAVRDHRPRQGRAGDAPAGQVSDPHGRQPVDRRHKLAAAGGLLGRGPGGAGGGHPDHRTADAGRAAQAGHVPGRLGGDDPGRLDGRRHPDIRPAVGHAGPTHPLPAVRNRTNRNRAVSARWRCWLVTTSVAGDPPPFATCPRDRSLCPEATGLMHLHAPLSWSRTAMSGGGAVLDFDGDGDQDLFMVTSGGAPDRLYRNDGDGTFTDVARAAGVARVHRGQGAAAADVDGDGDPDLFVASQGPAGEPRPGFHLLYRNDGPAGEDGMVRFTEIARPAGVAATSAGIESGMGASFGDYDLDGDLDLFVAAWSGEVDGNTLFRNDGVVDGVPRFTDVTRGRPAAGVAHADRGRPRLHADLRGRERRPLPGAAAGRRLRHPSRYYVNRGDGTFAEIATDAKVKRGGWGWGAVAIDHDLDGRLDIAATGGWNEANGEGFPEWADQRSVLFGNMERRLDPDLPLFADRTGPAGFAHRGQGRGMVHLDYDDDGDQDIVIFNNEGRPALLRNDAIHPARPPAGGWLRVFPGHHRRSRRGARRLRRARRRHRRRRRAGARHVRRRRLPDQLRALRALRPGGRRSHRRAPRRVAGRPGLPLRDRTGRRHLHGTAHSGGGFPDPALTLYSLPPAEELERLGDLAPRRPTDR